MIRRVGYGLRIAYVVGVFCATGVEPLMCLGRAGVDENRLVVSALSDQAVRIATASR